MVYLHVDSTNRARRRATSLIRHNALPLRHATLTFVPGELWNFEKFQCSRGTNMRHCNAADLWFIQFADEMCYYCNATVIQVHKTLAASLLAYRAACQKCSCETEILLQHFVCRRGM